MTNPRIYLFCYSEVGYAVLETMIAVGHPPASVFSHYPDPGETVWWHPIPELCKQHNVPCYSRYDGCAPGTEPDLIISAYCRRLLPMGLIQGIKLGAFNIHGSLLPKYRGRCPVNWAVIHGERITGATLHRMTDNPDAGPIVAQEEVIIGKGDLAIDVMWRVVEASRKLIQNHLEPIIAGTATETPQDESQATYCGPRRPEDGMIDWHHSTRWIYNLVRALAYPWPGARCYLPDGLKLVVWETKPMALAPFSSGTSYPAPGTMVESKPLVMATADGAIELTKYEEA